MQTPAPASTVVLLRRQPDAFEVFLVRRHDSVAFMGGAHVFPGGRIDASDYLADAEELCDGTDGAVRRLASRSRDEAIAFHVAAIRELFEEAGVLLARDRHGDFPSLTAETPRVADYRRQLHGHAMSLQELATRERVRLALDALVLFAHWVTPPVETRRFDTHFFLAVAPETQQADADPHETTEGIWTRPAEALDRCLNGEIALPPPTWTTLRALSRCDTVAEARAWAAAQTVPRIEPCFLQQEDGTRIVMLPGDPLCPPVEGFSAEEKRFLLNNGRWQPIG
jgi:8-oxo-dGTP pyrophosphatase MutT (NUDIX family)